ncbi:carboxylating nicotinate-nucleotide diphosphorylase [Candidatus Woesearchaeota archaeon]|nr:carboxylating nicotinate-nucleotide diphosphorylase [Candidatus Woesearchaeota archaeon]
MLRRERLVLEFWDRSRELTVRNSQYRIFVNELFSLLRNQDLGKGDLTTSTIKSNKKISAVIIAKENGIFAGLEEFKFLNRDLKIKSMKNDGDNVKKGDTLIQINGPVNKILERERTSLNLLQRMSGIATTTNELVRKAKGKAHIVATRKTLWGLVDKKAVSVGGGLTHRLNLSDGIIIKDNHLKILNFNIENALRFAKNKSRYIEIEIENANDALTAARTIKKLKNGKSLFAVMFDNMSPKSIREAIKELKNQNLYEHILLEASGNINKNNLIEYANSGVDVVSMGFITNSANVLNLSQEIL